MQQCVFQFLKDFTISSISFTICGLQSEAAQLSQIDLNCQITPPAFCAEFLDFLTSLHYNYVPTVKSLKPFERRMIRTKFQWCFAPFE